MREYTKVKELSSITASIRGIQHKHVVRTDDGRVWLMKTEDGSIERYALEIADACGLLTPEVALYRGRGICPDCELETYSDGTVALIEWLDDAMTVQTSHRSYSDFDPKDMIRLVVLDALLDNMDRHDGNILDWHGTIIPIDHGLALVRQWQYDFSNFTFNEYHYIDRWTPESVIMEVAQECMTNVRAYLRRSSSDRHLKGAVLRRMRYLPEVIHKYCENNKPPTLRIVTQPESVVYNTDGMF